MSILKKVTLGLQLVSLTILVIAFNAAMMALPFVAGYYALKALGAIQ